MSDKDLSHDAVVSDEDVERACKTIFPRTWDIAIKAEDDPRSENVRAALSSFAARRAAVPDAMDAFASQPEGLNYADGWNACREAMLAQRDGGNHG